MKAFFNIISLTGEILRRARGAGAVSTLKATTRQLTGTPYIHHAYVCDDNKVIAACTHRHGERRSAGSGAVHAQRCAERMLRRVLRRLSEEQP